MSDVPNQIIMGEKITGWSILPCRNSDRHKPHSWDRLYLLFGPYACPGCHEAVPVSTGRTEDGVVGGESE